MTLEQVNAMLNTKFTLIKRDGTINEGNARIAKRLSGLTEEDVKEFMRTDAGWNMSPAEKHAKGYHALRALDKWYRERGERAGDSPAGESAGASEGAGAGAGASEGAGAGAGASEGAGAGAGASEGAGAGAG
ncbi:MAG: hypothetical protein IIY21_21455, partial [Clostridiales bacterium]|nr:hypothetical protein [Clostridiales bacterium]